jgi:hypothetical protein
MNPIIIEKKVLQNLVSNGMTEDQILEYLINHLYTGVHKQLKEIENEKDN